MDGIGAGDAFCAGFLTAWLRTKTLSECAAFGNKTARLVLNAPGAQTDEKSLKDLARDYGV
jgi:sugar/nucleoside kinase (ribokinase family)